MKRIRIVLFLCIYFSVGCVNRHITVSAPEKQLKSRISAYVVAKKAEDFETEYTFLSPGYRKEVTFLKFVQSRKNKLEDLTLKEIKHEKHSDTATIVLNVTMNALGTEFKNFPIEQTWVLIDGQWFFDNKSLGFHQLFMPQAPSGKVK